jgi:hypothetical protein
MAHGAKATTQGVAFVAIIAFIAFIAFVRFNASHWN